MPEEIENKAPESTQSSASPAASSPKSSNFFQKNKTPILIIILVILTAFLVMLALTPSKKSLTPPASTPKAIVNPADTTLSMNPATSSAVASKSVDVNIDTGKNHANAIQLELSFDPSVVTNVSIIKGPFTQSFLEIYKKVDVTNGRISFTLGAPIGSKGLSGSGVTAVITYTQVSNTTPAEFKFLPKTAVTDPSFSQTALKSSTNFISQ